MGRGVSSGGGESSLGYLFGGGENPDKAPAAPVQVPPVQAQPTNEGRSQNAAAASPTEKQIPAGVPGHLTNNYHRAEGQNCGNFITDRPSTKVHAAPGGGSSLDYLFGGPPPGEK
ncbi:protein SPIRAL1-like 2 [Prosopis cineraria]|uniref:protein SPIRAL1-like 2 n=1 Tax=Prosopis cineraria TaxID=364024 RepID=UPI0024100F6F|nr:protein SPIRAL1-like 2 [Prosopis cineraria]XP_054798984.1 protein SPIRAL1-like 2 [Prosopis cineraria]XP_054798990.1 protein SPIRAL1-like 2 [Prosopis cineraria]XP_054798999.1 protein SPIRAL1-like 2 [Prosopis cineraria]